jgi:hypothetical protein
LRQSEAGEKHDKTGNKEIPETQQNRKQRNTGNTTKPEIKSRKRNNAGTKPE